MNPQFSFAVPVTKSGDALSTYGRKSKKTGQKMTLDELRRTLCPRSVSVSAGDFQCHLCPMFIRGACLNKFGAENDSSWWEEKEREGEEEEDEELLTSQSRIPLDWFPVKKKSWRTDGETNGRSNPLIVMFWMHIKFPSARVPPSPLNISF